MDCERVQQDLSAYLRGELPLSDRAAIQGHLSECPTCAEEAAAVKEFGHKLHVGLTDWVDQGVCPPDLMARIDGSVRAIGAETSRRRPWYRTWPAMVGAVATAAVLFLILGTQVGMQEQVAAIPLVGPLATQLFGGGRVNHLDEFRLVQVDAVDQHDGIKLTVSEVEAATDQTRIHYSLEGQSLDSSASDPVVYAGTLDGANGHLKPVRVTVVKRKPGLVMVDADFGPISQGKPLTFVVNGLPLKGGNSAPFTWRVPFNG